MIYERPQLIEFKATTAVGGDDCVNGGSAYDKCQSGGAALGGDCDNNGNRALTKCDTGGTY